MGKKLLSKSDVVQKAAVSQAAPLPKVAPVLADGLLLAVSRFPATWLPSVRSRAAEPEAPQWREFAAVDSARIRGAKTAQPWLPLSGVSSLACLERTAEPRNPRHLYGNGRGQKALLLNSFQAGIEIGSQWPHPKAIRKIGINECSHLLRMPIPRQAYYAELFLFVYLSNFLRRRHAANSA
jgi:hypothetical protein